MPNPLFGKLSLGSTDGYTDPFDVSGFSWAYFQAVKDGTADTYVGGASGIQFQILGSIITPEIGRDDIWSPLKPGVYLFEPGLSDPICTSGLMWIRAKVIGTAETGQCRYAFYGVV